MQNHPMHTRLQDFTRNRLKRTSFNHMSRNLHRRAEGLLPTSTDDMEMLTDFENPYNHLEDVSIITEVPGIGKKDCQAPHEMKTLALELIDEKYNPREWTHVFTDGSSEGAVKNGGAGIFIRHTDGRLTPKAYPTGKISSNYRAESTALLQALQLFTKSASPPQKIVFFTDCKSMLEGLQSTRNEQQVSDIKQALLILKRKSAITLQWIPAHCGFDHWKRKS